MSVNTARVADVKRFFVAGFLYAAKQAQRERDSFLIEDLHRLQADILHIPDDHKMMLRALVCFEPGNTMLSDMATVRDSFFRIRAGQCASGLDVLELFSVLYGKPTTKQFVAAGRFSLLDDEEIDRERDRKHKQYLAQESAWRDQCPAIKAKQEKLRALAEEREARAAAKQAAEQERQARMLQDAKLTIEEAVSLGKSPPPEVLYKMIRLTVSKRRGPANLMDDMVRAIRTSRLPTATLRERTGLNKQALRHIRKRATYASVPDERPAGQPCDYTTPKPSHRAALTPDDVREIRNSPEPNTVLMERYGMSRCAIHKVRRRMRYQTIEDQPCA